MWGWSRIAVMQRVVQSVLLVLSITFALCYMASHWHPVFVSEVWNQGAQWIDHQRGGVRWFYESQRNQWRSSGLWKSRHFLIPGFGLHSTTDGFKTVWIPGVRFDWCRQPAGYRRFVVGARYFTLAIVTALYPTTKRR